VAFDGPARAIRCASALTGASDRFNVTIRIGLHTGECTLEEGLPSGAPLSFAAGIACAASPGEVLVSRTVRDLVGDAGIPFEDRGVHHVQKGGEWRLFRV
jgi:class 3 adenylate cyclase